MAEDFNIAVLKLLDLFTEAQQQINHVEIEGYTLTCTFRFEKRAYYEIWHGERYIYESASLLDTPAKNGLTRWTMSRLERRNDDTHRRC